MNILFIDIVTNVFNTHAQHTHTYSSISKLLKQTFPLFQCVYKSIDRYGIYHWMSRWDKVFDRPFSCSIKVFICVHSLQF